MVKKIIDWIKNIPSNIKKDMSEKEYLKNKKLIEEVTNEIEIFYVKFTQYYKDGSSTELRWTLFNELYRISQNINESVQYIANLLNLKEVYIISKIEEFKKHHELMSRTYKNEKFSSIPLEVLNKELLAYKTNMNEKIDTITYWYNK